MTFHEFDSAIAQIAGDRYSSARVEASHYTSGRVHVQFAAYIEGLGWTKDYDRPQDVIAEMSLLSQGSAPVGATPESVGEIHAAEGPVV